jgi:hypothetical protein
LETTALELRIRKLERRLYGLLTLAALLAIGLGVRVNAAESRSILRARGLIIDDAQGRPRILIGAPFPNVAQRRRQDGTTNGIMFIDAQGVDRLLVGNRIPIPQIMGKVPAQFNSGAARGQESYGTHLFDAVGNERGSYAFNANGAAPGRAIISLDRLTGDAWGVAVNDKDDTAFELMNYAMQHGSAAAMNIQTGQDDAHMDWFDRSGQARVSLILKKGEPQFTISDASGKIQRDVFAPAR